MLKSFHSKSISFHSKKGSFHKFSLLQSENFLSFLNVKKCLKLSFHYYSRSSRKKGAVKNIFSFLIAVVTVLRHGSIIITKQKNSRFSNEGNVNSKPRNASLAGMKQIQTEKEITLPNLVFGLYGLPSCQTSDRFQQKHYKTPLGRIKLPYIKLSTILHKKTLCDIASVSSGTR